MHRKAQIDRLFSQSHADSVDKRHQKLTLSGVVYDNCRPHEVAEQKSHQLQPTKPKDELRNTVGEFSLVNTFIFGRQKNLQWEQEM